MIINERSRIKCKLDRGNLNWNEWPATVKQFNRIWLYIYIPKLISNILYITFDPLPIVTKKRCYQKRNNKILRIFLS